MKDYLITISGFVALSFWIWNICRSPYVLAQWAKAQGFEILHREYRIYNRGPFPLTGWHTVYFVRIRDGEGRERSGWVKCGANYAGMLSGKTEVKWQDEEK